MKRKVGIIVATCMVVFLVLVGVLVGKGPTAQTPASAEAPTTTAAVEDNAAADESAGADAAADAAGDGGSATGGPSPSAWMFADLTKDDIPTVDDSAAGTGYVADEVLVLFADGTDADTAQAALAQAGLSVPDDELEQDLEAGALVSAQITDGSTVNTALDKLRAAGDELAYAQPDYLYQLADDEPAQGEAADELAEAAAETDAAAAATTVNDKYASSQWYLDAINAYDAWDLQKTDQAVAVAVIDSGVDGTHEDLKNNLVAGYNSVDYSSDYDDHWGHGTHVAGIIAAQANNNVGIAGVSYNARVIPVAAGYLDGSSENILFRTEGIVEAYAYLLRDADHNGTSDLVENYKLRVINMSLGGLGWDDEAMLKSITAADQAGILTVCSAGNDNTDEPNYPSDFEPCMSVIALAQSYDDSLVRSDFSNYGDAKDIAAPGSYILSTYNRSYYYGEIYTYMDGTSMASPVVAGCAAEVFAANPSLTPEAVKSLLEETAQDLGTPGFDNDTAWGCVDLYAAVRKARGLATDTFTVTIKGDAHSRVSDGTKTAATLTEQVGANKKPTGAYTIVPDGDYTVVGFVDQDGNAVGDIADATITADTTYTACCVKAASDDVTTLMLAISADSRQPMLNLVPTGTVTIDWGDGTSQTEEPSTTQDVFVRKAQEYGAPGIYTVTISSDKPYTLGSGSDDYDGLLFYPYDDSLLYVKTASNARLKNARTGSYRRSSFSGCSNLVTADLSTCDMTGVTSLFNLFSGCGKLSTLDISGLNTAQVTSMYYMFRGCSSLKQIDLSKFDTSHVTDMSGMFQGCSSLTSLDVTYLNTVSVTDMSGMFQDCSSLTSLDVTYLNTVSVTDMGGMFQGCTSLTSLNFPQQFVTNKATSMYGMFQDCTSLKSISGLSHFDTSNAEYLAEMFSGCKALTSVDLSGFKNTNAGSLASMFKGCESLTSLTLPEGFVTLKATDLSGLFSGCKSLTQIEGLEHFNTSNVTDMSDMFKGCKSLTTLDLRSFDMSQVTSMSQLFWGCNALKTLELPQDIDTSQVTSMKHLFDGRRSLTAVDVSKFNTAKVTDMYAMFGNCQSLTELDVSHFDTSQVTTMVNMFWNCKALTSLDVSNFDTSNVQYLRWMFQDCSGLRTLTLGVNFKTSKCTDFTEMFQNCSSLTSLSLPAGFDTSQGTIFKGMFQGCGSLTSLDTSCLNLAKAGDASYLFQGCSALTSLDLSKSGAMKPGALTEAFADCTALKTLNIANLDTTETLYVKDLCKNDTSLQTVTVGDGIDFDGVGTYADEKFQIVSPVGTWQNVDTKAYYASADLPARTAATYTAAEKPVAPDNPDQPAQPTDISGATVTLSSTSYTYDGTAKKPGVTVTLAGQRLAEGTDYTVSYANNVNAGTATVTVTGKGSYTGAATASFTITKPTTPDNPDQPTQPTQPSTPTVSSVPMYRLYNPNSGEHFYTAKSPERDNLVSVGWNYEGVGWTAPSTGDPVYRLYNPNAGDHHYTTSVSERDSLVAVGWNYEGVGWYSGGSRPLWRQYNPNATSGAHNYTTSKDENDHLVSLGWRYEGIGWYGL